MIMSDLEVMAANATDVLKCICKCIKEKIEECQDKSSVKFVNIRALYKLIRSHLVECIINIGYEPHTAKILTFGKTRGLTW